MCFSSAVSMPRFKRASRHGPHGPQARAAKEAAALRRYHEQLNRMQAASEDPALTATFREIGVYFTPRGYYSHVCFTPNEKNALVRWPVLVKHLQEHDFCFVRVAQQFVDGQPVSGTERYFTTDICRAYSMKDTGFPWDLHVGSTPYVTIKCNGEKGSLTRGQLEYHLDKVFARKGHTFVPNMHMQMPYAAPVREFFQKMINQTSAEFGSQVIQVVPVYVSRQYQPFVPTDAAITLEALDLATRTTWVASDRISSGSQRITKKDNGLLADHRVMLIAQHPLYQWVSVANVKSTPTKKCSNISSSSKTCIKKRSRTASQVDAPVAEVGVKRHCAPSEEVVHAMTNSEVQHGDDDMESVLDDEDELDSQATDDDEEDGFPYLPVADEEDGVPHLDDFFHPAPLIGLIDPVADFNCEDLL